jgi:hypothetical protein
VVGQSAAGVLAFRGGLGLESNAKVHRTPKLHSAIDFLYREQAVPPESVF